jgi:hypothetical protein
MGVFMWKILLCMLITLSLSACGESIKDQKINAIKISSKYFADPKINQLTNKGEYLPFSEIEGSLLAMNKICKSDLIENDKDLQFLIKMNIQEEMFNYPHVLRGFQTYEVVKSSNNFPSLYPDISDVFKNLVRATPPQKDMYVQLLERFHSLRDYKKYTTHVTKLKNDLSSKKSPEGLESEGLESIDNTFMLISMHACTISDVILGIYGYETQSSEMAYGMIDKVSKKTRGVTSKIYTSYDNNGCPVYKNADGKVLQKSTLLRQKDGC